MSEPGTFQPAAPLATCAAEPCDADAETEALHGPTSDIRVWVPLCGGHRDAVMRGEAIEYIVEIHGFVPAAEDPA